jgi:carboxypeptidase PM20D1
MAQVRTTTALTIFRAGAKENVLPASATAVVNHRIHPADSVASVLRRDKRVINDPTVQIEVHLRLPCKGGAHHLCALPLNLTEC